MPGRRNRTLAAYRIVYTPYRPTGEDNQTQPVNPRRTETVEEYAARYRPPVDFGMRRDAEDRTTNDIQPGAVFTPGPIYHLNGGDRARLDAPRLINFDQAKKPQETTPKDDYEMDAGD